MFLRNLKPRPKSYPFGSSINTRSFSAGSGFRFGFNGKEKQNEIWGDDYDFGARIYDGRLGRWFSVDPVYTKYPNSSTYCFVANSLFMNIEINGSEYIVIFDSKNKTITVQAKFKIIKSGNEDIDKGYLVQINEALDFYNNSNDFQELINENGIKVAYNVVFNLTLISTEHDESNCIKGPVNTIEIQNVVNSESYNSEDLGGLYFNGEIKILSEFATNEYNVIKHEIGHSLGMDHDVVEGKLMSEVATKDPVYLSIENIKNTLGSAGIGPKPTHRSSTSQLMIYPQRNFPKNEKGNAEFNELNLSLENAETTEIVELK
jgi:RHS repeat-associated protein